MAFAIMLKTLKKTLAGSGLFRADQTHCVRLAVHPIRSVSGKLISSTPSRINRKFTDIVPSMPGN